MTARRATKERPSKFGGLSAPHRVREPTVLAAFGVMDRHVRSRRIRAMTTRRLLALLVSQLTRLLAEPSKLVVADWFGFGVVGESNVRA